MKDNNVIDLPSATLEKPLFGIRAEDALRYMLQELGRVVKIAERAVTNPARGFATSGDLGHLANMYTRGEIICQIGNEAFPFSDYPFKKHGDVYKANAEYARELYLETVRREAEIALNCQKAGA